MSPEGPLPPPTRGLVFVLFPGMSLSGGCSQEKPASDRVQEPVLGERAPLALAPPGPGARPSEAPGCGLSLWGEIQLQLHFLQ